MSGAAAVEPAGASRAAILQGFLLILLALLGGILAPYMVNARMGVGAHIIGFFGGMILILIGLVRPLLTLSGGLWRTMQASWFVAAYGNWVAAMLGGLTGASRLTPIAGAGTTGTPLAEAVVFSMFTLVGISSLIGAGIAVYGLRRPPPAR